MAANQVVSAATAAAAAAAAAAASCLPSVPFPPSLDPQRILVLHCELCAFLTLDISKLFEHCLSRHANTTHTCSLYQCNLCGTVTTYEPLLEEHNRAWHPYDKLSSRCLSQTRWNTSSGVNTSSSNNGAGLLSGDPSTGPPSPGGPPCRSVSSAARGQLRRCVFCAFSSPRWSALSTHYTEVHNVAKVAKGLEEVSSAELEPGCSSSAQGRALSIGENGPHLAGELSPMSTIQRKRLRTLGAVGGGGSSGGDGGDVGDDGGGLGEEALKSRKLELPTRHLLHHGGEVELPTLNGSVPQTSALQSLVNGGSGGHDGDGEGNVDLEEAENAEETEDVEEEMEEDEEMEEEEEESVVMVKQEFPSSPYTFNTTCGGVSHQPTSSAAPITALPSVMTLRASPFGPTVFPSMMPTPAMPSITNSVSSMVTPLRHQTPLVTTSSLPAPATSLGSSRESSLCSSAGMNTMVASVGPTNLPSPLAAMLRHPMAPPSGPPRGSLTTSPVELLTNGGQNSASAAQGLTGNGNPAQSFTSTPKLPHGAAAGDASTLSCPREFRAIASAGGYTCQYCGKVYRSRKYCAEHEYTCSGLVRLQCACGLVCKWRSYYYSHRKSCPVYLASVGRAPNTPNTSGHNHHAPPTQVTSVQPPPPQVSNVTSANSSASPLMALPNAGRTPSRSNSAASLPELPTGVSVAVVPIADYRPAPTATEEPPPPPPPPQSSAQENCGANETEGSGALDSGPQPMS